ncbi:MAG TPA: hypothetical protein VL382_11985 [Terriglobales bacterium]|nr:hypothetical protein [Terriglobales bacterium]
MRRSLAIALLLVLAALTSGASTVVCAGNCGRVPLRAPAMPPMASMHHPGMSCHEAPAVMAANCMRTAQAPAIQRSLPSAFAFTSASAAAAAEALPAVEPAAVQVVSAHPPGSPPPITQLRI